MLNPNNKNNIRAAILSPLIDQLKREGVKLPPGQVPACKKRKIKSPLFFFERHFLFRKKYFIFTTFFVSLAGPV